MLALTPLQGALASLPEAVMRSAGVAGPSAAATATPAGAASTATSSSSPSHTTVYVGMEGRVVGVISLADAVRPDAKATIQDLHDQGIRTIMLSGARARKDTNNDYNDVCVSLQTLPVPHTLHARPALVAQQTGHPHHHA